MSIQLPDCGFVFWPVGCGDSTTIAVDPDHVVQVDIHHVEKAEDDEDPRWAVVDHLVEVLPKRSGKPYLAVFVLTHLDGDHCKGFAELLERVLIGELWFTPRVFQELEDEEDMCADAEAFCKEAKRRMELATIGGAPSSGDRLRVVGWSDLLQAGDFAEIPEEFKTVPGHAVSTIDGDDVSKLFRAFIHAPFKDDADGDRNGTSIGMQVTLHPGPTQTTALLLGDLDHGPIERIFERSEASDLEWNILLAPHHCSKSVMYVKVDGKEQLDQTLVDAIEGAGADPRWIVSSSMPVPKINTAGDSPPHAKAKARYETMVNDGSFLCTGDHTDPAAPIPVVFEANKDGCTHVQAKAAKTKQSAVAEAISKGRGGDAPHATTVGFGRGSGE